MVVFENRFPSFARESSAAGSSADPLLGHAPALGRCEVVCFTSDHGASFSSLSTARARTVVDVWADRTRELPALSTVEDVFIFENRGQEIGVTLHHPHGQIYAYPFVPARTASLLRAASEHHQRTGRLLGADLLAAELDAGSRVVIRGVHWTAYVPYAARWPVEVHLVPNRDVPDLVALDDDERDELAEVYLDLLRRLDRFYEGPDGSPISLPYIAGWHQAPVRQGREVSRLHLQVMSVLRAPGRLKYLAGSESGVGAWINDVAPEQVAARLRGDCRDDSIAQVPFDLTAHGLALLIMDTRAGHMLGDGQYAQRRASCEEAARLLAVSSLREVAFTDLDQTLDLLQDNQIRARARHVVTEIERVRQSVALLREGRLPDLGPLFNASHASMRDDFEISCPELDLAVETANSKGALGARMTGGGFGGSAIALVPAESTAEVSSAVIHAFASRGFGAPSCFAVSAGGSARRES